jgi:methyl-accepting chemotaxis protein
MKNIKLLPKLIGGFVLVALIIVGVGYFGATGSARLSGQLDALGKVVLPSATGILRMRLAMAEIHSAELSLLRKGLADNERVSTYSEIASAKKEIDGAREAYNAIPKTQSEKALWDRFNSTWDSWWNQHMAFEQLEKDHYSHASNQLADLVYEQSVSQTLDQGAVPYETLTKILADIDLLQFQYAAAALSTGARVSSQVRLATLIGFIVGPVLALVFGFLIAFSISRPLARGVAFAEVVARGDLTQRFDIDRDDEVGKLAAALNFMVEKLNELMQGIQDSAHRVASSSEALSSAAVHLSEGAQTQASTLEETSASVEELTASVDHVSEHAQAQAAAVEEGSSSMAQVNMAIEEATRSLGEIAELTVKSVEKSEEGARAVQEVAQGIGLIADSSQKIGGIVSVISDIADQTNLLALNASIEAARAGEHGRGFAVVASEVSKLADRSSASTKEIEALIKDSVKNVTRGVQTAQGSQSAMEQIRSTSEKVREMIAGLSQSMGQQLASVRELARALTNINEMSQNISAATEEQSSSARQVSKAVESVNDVTQAAAASAEQMSGATEEMSRMARELQKLVEQFRIAAVSELSGESVPLVAVHSAEAAKDGRPHLT